MFCETSTFHTRFDTRLFLSLARPARRAGWGLQGARWGRIGVGQADGLRQRQPKSAAEDEGFADISNIMAALQAQASPSAFAC